LSGVLERHPDVGMVFPDYYHVDSEGTVIEIVRRHDFDEVTLHDQPAHGACTMIRRQCLLDLDGYDESLRCQDGYDLWIRFIEKFEVRNVNLPLFYYRQHNASLTRNEVNILKTRGDILRRHAARRNRKLKVVAIIPVRGPAADPSSPALRGLGGRPLIDWTLDTALAAERVADVVVTTPDESVIAHVKARYGEKVFVIRRDSRLALPNTYIEDTLLDALSHYRTAGRAADALLSLTVESPFRESRHLNSAVDVMELFDTDCVVGVRPENDLFYQHNGAGLVPLRKNAALRLERDELFRGVAGLELVLVDYLMQTRQIIGKRLGHVVIDQRAALSLKTPFDWQIAEILAIGMGSGTT
jgi:CMP-N-acetylneuraminic acid synthetase